MKTYLFLVFLLVFNSTALAQKKTTPAKNTLNFNDYFIYDGSSKSAEVKKYGTGIDLSRSGVKDQDLKQLKEPRYNSVTWISFRSTEISDSALKYLSDLPLKTLILEDTEITGEGFKDIKGLPLKELNLENTKVDDQGLENLKDLKITDLNLTGTEITDEGILKLQDLPLENLSLYSTSISDLGLENLYRLNLPLKKLFLTGTQVSEAKVEWLKDKLPEIIIIY